MNLESFHQSGVGIRRTRRRAFLRHVPIHTAKAPYKQRRRVRKGKAASMRQKNGKRVSFYLTRKAKSGQARTPGRAIDATQMGTN